MEIGRKKIILKEDKIATLDKFVSKYSPKIDDHMLKRLSISTKLNVPIELRKIRIICYDQNTKLQTLLMFQGDNRGKGIDISIMMEILNMRKELERIVVIVYLEQEFKNESKVFRKAFNKLQEEQLIRIMSRKFTILDIVETYSTKDVLLFRTFMDKFKQKNKLSLTYNSKYYTPMKILNKNEVNNFVQNYYNPRSSYKEMRDDDVIQFLQNRLPHIKLTDRISRFLGAHEGNIIKYKPSPTKTTYRYVTENVK